MWQGRMHGRGTCMEGAMHGRGVHGRVACMVGWGCVWQER